MGLGPGLINRLLIGALTVVVAALAVNELGPDLAPTVKRYRARLLPDRPSAQLFLPLVVGLILAGLMRALLVSVYFLVAGTLTTLFLLLRARREQHDIPAREVFQLVLAFRSTFQLQPSVFSTLGMVNEKVNEPLRGLVDVMVRTFYLTSSPQRAFEELRSRTADVYLHQFAYILEMTETAQSDAVVVALDNLVERLRSHDELRRQSEANLTSVTGQTTFIQGIAILLMVGVAFVPVLRIPYTTIGGQLLLIVVVTVMLLTSYYIDRVIRTLAERIS